MDPTAFSVIAGADAADAYIATIARPSTRVQACWDSESLCHAQVEARRLGYEAAVLVPTVYGWSVREASFDRRVLAGTRRGDPLDGTYDAAVSWARAWVAERPGLRWAFVRAGTGGQQDGGS